MKALNIDEYIAGFPESTKLKLNQIRSVIKKAAPLAIEKIVWSMPTFYQNGNLVHFAAYKNHIGFYPGPQCLQEFAKEISVYKNSVGAVQFPIDENLPIELISNMVTYRIEQMMLKNTRKKHRKLL